MDAIANVVCRACLYVSMNLTKELCLCCVNDELVWCGVFVRHESGQRSVYTHPTPSIFRHASRHADPFQHALQGLTLGIASNMLVHCASFVNNLRHQFGYSERIS